jgi:hypothetical protein
MKLRDDEKMDYDEELFNKKDLRKKRDKKRVHKNMKEHEDDECSKESFKKMKEEIDELRKREIVRAKELDELKKKVEERDNESSNSPTEPDYALDFDRDTYLSKGFIESAKWIKDVVAKNMIDKMNKDPITERFVAILKNKKASTYLGIRTCARYNRGELCNFGKLHATHKPEVGVNPQPQTMEHQTYREHRISKTSNGCEASGNPASSVHERLGRRNETRIHACTLCMEAFGSANGHSVLNCPWILQKNWS